MKSRKILFANFPGDGHFNPLTGLAIHLKNSGHDVRWYTGSKYETKIKKLGFTYYPLLESQTRYFPKEKITTDRSLS
jgi:UDP:flavonoid glycosyltransferase YjiC (YdhE family)